MPIVSGGGGGGGTPYTPPTARAQYAGNQVSVGNAASASLTWDALTSGTALLNITSPALPTVVTAGVYAVTVQLGLSGLTAAGFYVANLELDVAGDDPEVTLYSPPASATETPLIVVANTYYIPAGGQIQVTVANHDGAASRQFGLSAFVQRIT